MADIFDEVNEDLRAERARQFFSRYAVYLIAAVLLMVVGVIGWQMWQRNTATQANATATGFLTAMRQAGSPAEAATPARAEAAAEFERLAASGPEGYRTLARLRAAALKVSGGDLPAALVLWDRISADTAADPLLRDLANLLWVQHQVDAGDPAAVQGRIAPLVAPGNPWRYLAQENQALLLLRTGEAEKARGLLRQLSADPAAPDGVRGRTSGLLARFGDPAPASSGAGG